MDILKRFNRLSNRAPLLCLAKNTEYAASFAHQINACSMYLPGFGLNIPSHFNQENQIRGAMLAISRAKGYFIFNINWVNLKAAKKGFADYEEAEWNNMITEWELALIMRNPDYLRRTFFHNGKVVFTQVRNFNVLRWQA